MNEPTVDDYKQAWAELRDAVLNERFQLAEMEAGPDILNAVLGIIDDHEPQPTTPEPAGETVRVTTEWLSGLAMQIVFNPDVVKEIQSASSDDMPSHRLLRAKAAAMECIERYAVNTLAMPLPRTPTVAARVVEGQS